MTSLFFSFLFYLFFILLSFFLLLLLPSFQLLAFKFYWILSVLKKVRNKYTLMHILIVTVDAN